MPDASGNLLRTCLHDKHLAAGAEMSVCDGWEMPRSYGDPAGEYRALHERAAVTDLSCVGRIRIRGDGALDLLEHLCTADVTRQEDDTAVYTLLCNEGGGIVDHGFVLRLDGYWLLTCSPGRREAVLGHLLARAEAFGAKVDDQTLKTSMLAVVGPAAGAILDAVLPQRTSGLARGAVKAGSMLVARYVAMRAGATRLWSLEVMLPNMLTGAAWGFITKKAQANALPPAGLAAREALRIEAGICRWGREIDEGVDPVTAGLEKAVDFGKDFLGAEAVRAVRDRGPARRRVRLLLRGDAPGLPAPGAAVVAADGRPIGEVTSAAFSPALGGTIALAYVDAAAQVGTEVSVRASAGRSVPAELLRAPA